MHWYALFLVSLDGFINFCSGSALKQLFQQVLGVLHL